MSEGSLTETDPSRSFLDLRVNISVTAVQLPVIEELPIAPDPEAAFLRLSHLPHVLFLDSALREAQLGRFSFLTADPFEFFWTSSFASDPLARCAARWNQLRGIQRPELPPFQGGIAGLFGYGLSRSLERVPAPRFDEFQTPDLAVGCYDVVLAFDHNQGRAWWISQGFPETNSDARRRRAELRLAQFKQALADGPTQRINLRTDPLDARCLAPQFPTPGVEGLSSNFSREGYMDAVRRAVDYIYAGDIFQVNLSQRLLYPASGDAVDLYLRLRHRNPATFAAYFDTGKFQILSASPERLVQLRDGCVETRPIKGTRPRIARPEADLYAADELRQSEKDRAENVMIVDLMRNDLSRVCQPETVRVTDLCRLEAYQFVQHLVSCVQGRLQADKDPFDLIRAVFPGGSVTGAPKVRAMEIIAELEPTARGPYCGSLGYIGFDGSLDFNILIRTMTAGRGWWQLPVGGGIVVQSDPRLEYEETWHKATGLVRALLP